MHWPILSIALMVIHLREKPVQGQGPPAGKAAHLAEGLYLASKRGGVTDHQPFSIPSEDPMPIDNRELCDHLVSLAQLDIDAVHAYTQAIDKIDVTEVKSQLTRFREDHHRHVRDFSPIIERLGGTPPEFKT